jgi:hypothetical protein
MESNLPGWRRSPARCKETTWSSAMRSGSLIVDEHAPGRELLRRELAQFDLKPGARGQLRMEACRGHDDLVIATAIAVLASDLAKVTCSERGRLISR